MNRRVWRRTSSWRKGQDWIYNAVFRSHAAKLYSWPKQLFLFSKQGKGGGHYNYNTVFCSNAADLYLWQSQLFLSSELGGRGR